MSADVRWLVDGISPGNGWALDLGGGTGGCRPLLESQGYRYVNVDVRRSGNGEPTVLGSAEELPFRDQVFDLVISKDSLEHFLEPWRAVDEVYRVLRPGGSFLIWVPFMHGFHGDDAYRYTPLGLRHLLRGFRLVALESPLWVFSLLGQIVAAPLTRIRARRIVSLIRIVCAWCDALFTARSSRPRSLAVAYRVIAVKDAECSTDGRQRLGSSHRTS